MREAVIVASSRTPLAKSFRGSFNLTRPDDFAAHCIKDVLGKVPQLDPTEVEDVILGCGQPHGPQGHNVARVAAVRAGLPVSVGGLTVNRFCSSGLQAIAIAANYIINNGADATLEGLLALPPHFDKESGQGTVTAGNSSQLSDGASATLVMSMERAKQLGIRPKLVFRGFAIAGCAPDEMGIGPVFAVPKLLRRSGLKIGDIDVWELNEAFASQVVYCRDRLGLDPEKLNRNGGSISIGHPFGMTGSRMVGTIANEMLHSKARYGVVTMCIGGGQGAAGLFEACN